MWKAIVLVIACVIVIWQTALTYAIVTTKTTVNMHSRKTAKATIHYLSLLTSNLRVVQEGIRVVDTPSSCFPLPRPLKDVLIPPGPKGQLRDIVDVNHGDIIEPLHPVIKTHPIRTVIKPFIYSTVKLDKAHVRTQMP